MSMTKFALLGLVLFLTRASLEWQLTKCCPPGQIYVNNSTKCISKPSYAIEVYVHYWNTTTELQEIPQCDKSEDVMTTPLDDLESNTILEVPTCLETRLELTGENTIIIVQCQSNKDQQVKAINTTFPQLSHVRKCCFGDSIFDSGTKTCVTRLNESQSLETFLLNKSTDTESVVIATQGPPKCKGPIVNYEVNEHDIFLRNNTYWVMVPTFKNNIKEQPVTEDNACLEMTSEFASKQRLIVRVCRDLEFCDTNTCIRKCCPEDEYFYNGYGCEKRPMPNEPGEFYKAFANAVNQTNSFTFNTTKDYGVLIRLPCHKISYFNNSKKWEEHVLLTSNGHVFLRNDDINNMHCFDIIYDEFDNFRFDLIICSRNLLFETHRRADWWFAVLFINCVCLCLTLLVYAYLPNLQNLHGKMVIMCYVSNLLLDFIFTFINDWYYKVASEKLSSTLCKSLAYIVHFFSLSTHFWLNVMCFDMWRTLVTLRENSTSNRKNRKRFLLYCLYAWGISFLFSILLIVADNTDILPDYLEPNIDNSVCWLTFTDNWNSYSELIFAYGPETILLILNIVFFTLTSKYYNNVKADIKNAITDPRSKLHSNRKRFIINIKLFTIMGMICICQTVNYLLYKYLGYKHWAMLVFYYINTVYDSIQGLLIFILFVLKKSVYQAIRRRLGL